MMLVYLWGPESICFTLFSVLAQLIALDVHLLLLFIVMPVGCCVAIGDWPGAAGLLHAAPCPWPLLFLAAAGYLCTLWLFVQHLSSVGILKVAQREACLYQVDHLRLGSLDGCWHYRRELLLCTGAVWWKLSSSFLCLAIRMCFY